MKKAATVSCLFLDIGGVVLTDGWDHHARKRAAVMFDLERAEFEARHRQVFEPYEAGKITLDEYLQRVVFHTKRAFTPARFRRFMFAQSKPHRETFELIAKLRARHHLKVAVVSNEAREINAYRFKKFGLTRLADVFVSSCFVHLRKPDADIFRLALDLVQTPARNVVYVDNTPMFLEVAADLGIRGVLHTDCRSTRAQLARLGLALDDGEASKNGD